MMLFLLPLLLPAVCAGLKCWQCDSAAGDVCDPTTAHAGHQTVCEAPGDKGCFLSQLVRGEETITARGCTANKVEECRVENNGPNVSII